MLVSHVSVEIIIIVAGEDVEVIMECVLAPCWLVVLELSDPVTLVITFHCDGDLFGNVHNVSCELAREIIDILVVLVGYYYDVTWVVLDPERVDKGADLLVLVDEILLEK